MRSGSFRQKSLIPSVLAVVLLTVPTNVFAHIHSAAAADEQAGFGFTTGLVGIVQGQTARLSVWNKGDKDVLTRLQFVDEQGKVLILCDAIIQPGKAITENFSIADGSSNRNELQAQFGTNEKKLIGLLVPTLQVVDNATGANSWMIGQDGFVEFRPIWVPTLIPPVPRG
jgi:hypothetical protein